jgi:hypothetical protein
MKTCKIKVATHWSKFLKNSKSLGKRPKIDELFFRGTSWGVAASELGNNCQKNFQKRTLQNKTSHRVV